MAKLYFRYGAMGSGKTIHLLKVAYNYEERGHEVCIIKPRIDTKAAAKVKTRIGLERDTDFTFSNKTNLYSKIKHEYPAVSCILLDEAQFATAEQIDQLAKVAAELNIPVIAYGLRLNFRQDDDGFAGATRLLQVAEDITEIKTICECGRKATRTTRFLSGTLATSGPAILIDDGKGRVEYRALCTKCYFRYLAKTKNN